MASRQDQLHSYQFTVQRVVAAVIMRETDPAQSPFRRAAGATLAGVLVAALGLAAVAVYGVLAPRDTGGWREPGAVIVERESGARYVYLDGRLHPVLNYASALLILGSAQAHTVGVARTALAGVPRGAPLGIAAAPDSLPDPGRLLGLPWTLCSSRSAGTALYVGMGLAGGQQVGADAGLLVRTPDGALHLIWHERRFPIPEQAVVRAAFGWGGQMPEPVPAAFANAVAQGPDLVPPAIPGPVGVPSRVVPRLRVGGVVVVATQGGARQFAVVLAGGLAPISQVQADLLLSDPARVAKLGQSRADPMSQADFSQAPAADLPAAAAGLPDVTPRLVHPSLVDGGVCARFDGTQGAARIAVDVPLPAADPVPAHGASLADRILVPPGRGAVVEAAAAPGAPGGVVCVLTDLGLRYPVPTVDVLGMLGYAAVHPVRVPASLVALVPAGHVLDPAAARAPVGVN
jgi:type VII secretion protein EccB